MSEKKINKRYSLKTFPEMIGLNSSIRSRNDIVFVILKTMTRFMYDDFKSNDEIDTSTDKDSQNICVIINIDKMSRIFLISCSKIHTFHFPFTITCEDNSFKFTHNGEIVDDATNSALIEFYNFIRSDEVNPNSKDYPLILLDKLTDIGEKIDKSDLLQSIVMMLQTFEIGYLRYDYDNSDRADEKMHPINHLDINFSSSATYKIGLENSLKYDDLEEIINTNKICKFLKND